ncbi:MAG: phage head closure protein [Thermodesulfobacteriota bacterium]|jgi:SPP1 family predicted phage head-tail adaptor
MNAGRLRHRVTIQAPGLAAASEYGDQATIWSDVATVWADIQPMSGRELFAAQAVQSEATVKITMRYRADLTTAMRLAHGSTIYDIHHVPPVAGQGNELTLLCSTGRTRG